MKVSVTHLYQAYSPNCELSEFVECYWHWEADGNGKTTEFILPDAAPELMVHLGTVPEALYGQDRWQEQSRAFIYCAAEKCLELRMNRPMNVFGIRFQPWGLSWFSDQPMSNLLDREVAPGEALGELAALLVQAVRTSSDDKSRVTNVDKCLIDALGDRPGQAQSLDSLMPWVAGGARPEHAMAERLARSPRTVRRYWRELVGISARSYAKLMRVHRALALIEEGQPLATVALDSGFADQAHMARQIKEVTGLSPSRLKTWLGEQVYQDLYVHRPGAPWKKIQ